MAGDYRAAQQALDKMIANEAARVGSDAPELATALKVAAGICSRMGDPRQAHRYFEKAIALLDAKGLLDGSQEPEEASDLLQQAAEAARAGGDLGPGEALLRRSIALAQRAGDKGKSRVVSAHNNLGLLYEAQGRFAQAEQELEESVRLGQELHGPKDAALCMPLTNLGGLQLHRGSFDRAERSLTRAVEVNCANPGTMFARLDRSLAVYNLGALLFRRSDTKSAEPLFQQSLELRQTVLGDHHPDLALPLSGLALCRVYAGDLPGAYALTERQLAILSASLGDSHSHVAVVLSNLGEFAWEMGHAEQASGHLKRALEVSEHANGPEHPEFAQALRTYGVHLMRTGHADKAEPALQRAAALLEKSWGGRHPDVASAMQALAACHERLGQRDKALSERSRQLEIEGRVLELVLAMGSESQKVSYVTSRTSCSPRTCVGLPMTAALASKPSWSHPYFWAAFIPSGAWQNLEGKGGAVPTVEPGARGCGCRLGASERGPAALWLAIAAVLLRRRRRGNHR